MDEDFAATVARLQASVRLSGLSQGAFATAIGTSGSRFSSYVAGRVAPSAPTLLRAMRIADGLSRAAASGWLTAPATAAAVKAALGSGNELWAFKLLIQGRDHLHQILTSQPEMAAAWEARPQPIPSQQWQALFVALVAHEFDRAGRTTPEWTKRPPALSEPWILPSPRLTADEVRERTPPWLGERGIYVTARDLVTR